MTPELVVERGVLGLHRLGLTRQKASYCHALAQAVMDGSLSLSGIARGEDTAGRSALLQLRGIGPWSADIYYLMALRRPDVWPVGDLALAIALAEVKRLRARPDAQPPALLERRLGALAISRGAAPVALLSDDTQGTANTGETRWIEGQPPSGRATSGTARAR